MLSRPNRWEVSEGDIATAYRGRCHVQCSLTRVYIYPHQKVTKTVLIVHSTLYHSHLQHTDHSDRLITMAASAYPEGSIAYVNGNIYTVDKAQPRAGGFVVSPQGVFAAVGSSEEIKANAQAQGLVIRDLGGTFIMPGIHDSHVHSFVSGLHLVGDILMDLATTNTGDQMVAKLKNGCGGCSHHAGPSDWIIGVLLEIENYDRSILDEEWPDRPVFIHAYGGHMKYLNTAALEKAGFDVQNEPDAPSSIYQRRPDGSLTGTIGGQAALGRASMAIPKPSIPHLKKALKRAMKELHRNGVTSCQEAATNSVMLKVLNELDIDGQLKVDYSTHILYKNEWLSGEILADPEELIKSAERYLSKHVNTRFVKFMMDGGPGGPAVLQQAGLDKDGKPDMANILQPDLPELLSRCDQRGMTCKVHAMGEGGARLALDAVAAARKQNPNGPIHEVAHSCMVHKDDLGRFKDLNVTAEMSPAMFFANGFDYVKDQIVYDFPGFKAKNTRMTIGSDWAFGMFLPLLPSIAHLVDIIGAESLLEMLTINGATSVGKDKVSGSISVGKKANFIAVDRDLTKGDFANAKITNTWFEGEMVYEMATEYVERPALGA